jgi:vacuolar-type H+-ATPase subunit E/Vma4
LKLDPYREALLHDARARAEAMRAEATREAIDCATEARERADRMIREARADGEAAAERETAMEHVRARRRARRVVLEARSAAFARFRRAALEAAMAARSEPAYGVLLERLTALARDQLGDGAQLIVDPPGVGGVVAEVQGRRVDYTVAALVDRMLAQIAPATMDPTD